MLTNVLLNDCKLKAVHFSVRKTKETGVQTVKALSVLGYIDMYCRHKCAIRNYTQ